MYYHIDGEARGWGGWWWWCCCCWWWWYPSTLDINPSTKNLEFHSLPFFLSSCWKLRVSPPCPFHWMWILINAWRQHSASSLVHCILLCQMSVTPSLVWCYAWAFILFKTEIIIIIIIINNSICMYLPQPRLKSRHWTQHPESPDWRLELLCGKNLMTSNHGTRASGGRSVSNFNRWRDISW